LVDKDENININKEDSSEYIENSDKMSKQKKIKAEAESSVEGSETLIPVKRGKPKKVKEELPPEENQEPIIKEEIVEEKETTPAENIENQNVNEKVISETEIVPELIQENIPEEVINPEEEKEIKQEEEVPITISKKEGIKENSPEEKIGKESNYQISLVDENLLRVRVLTDKSVSIDCSVKDKYSNSDESNETQANKIFIHPKDKPQEIEIIVSIGSGGVTVVKDSIVTQSTEMEPVVQETQKAKLIPNPLVANLIQKFNPKKLEEEPVRLTPEEKLEEKLGPKNPWRVYKELMHRNLIIGFVGAVFIYIVFTVSFYSVVAKKNGNADVIDAPRLIVMQDLPENQFQQQNVEDPNKPPEEVKESGDDAAANTNKIPPITTKKINKPPRIIGPPRQKVDTTSTADKELDSLRNVNKNKNIALNNGRDDGTVTDTAKFTSGYFPFPDSVMRGLKENEVGLVGKFPPNWKQIDSREVDINKKEFSGVILVDTAVMKKEESLNMSVQIDKNNEYWKQYSFKNIFAEDSLKNVIYSIEPKQEGDQTYYRFYISGMAYNIYIAAFINNEHFEKHKTEIEQVVRTIKIQKPTTPTGK
jgi:hypothetical protein